ncbi:carbohydrate esterase family 16 protein [Collybiopsis luxurians FD-317 M1]|uniref:Unplaced genomic scaffold GYMLUscaffold_51, whole genome shotgun sequence n=1 Tax=Collybiopsis luxurians FD-317 M1 TaxID=944289 RepID=A0A0D0C1Q3_9AGAR|nr:carbohydrate esterase family 16 protein [Collybiopsis luxurians FD-317 M1]
MFTHPLALLSLVGAASAAPNNFWFSFGDSYTQTGFLPNETLPSAGNPFGNPPYPGFTATGGPNWIDFDTVTNNNSLIFTYNYAFGGATIDASLVAPFEPTVLSVTDQVNQFLDTVANKPASTPWTSQNSLFSIWIGINDLGNSYFLSDNRTSFDTVLLNAEFALVEKLYDVGARNFLFLNVPPTDRSPLLLSQSTTAQAMLKANILDFNSQLVTFANNFKATHSGVKTFIWDANAAFTTILNDPTAFGFQDATSFGDAPNFFWINTLHTTSAANVFWAEGVAQTLAGTVF